MPQKAMNAMDSEPHLKTSSRSPETTTGRPARQIGNVNTDSGFSVKIHWVYYLVVFSSKGLFAHRNPSAGSGCQTLSLSCLAAHIDTITEFQGPGPDPPDRMKGFSSGQ